MDLSMRARPSSPFFRSTWQLQGRAQSSIVDREDDAATMTSSSVPLTRFGTRGLVPTKEHGGQSVCIRTAFKSFRVMIRPVAFHCQRFRLTPAACLLVQKKIKKTIRRLSTHCLFPRRREGSTIASIKKENFLRNNAGHSDKLYNNARRLLDFGFARRLLGLRTHRGFLLEGGLHWPS